MKQLISFFALLLTVATNAQVVFNRTSHSYGEITAESNTIIDFKITNHSYEDVFILRAANDFEVSTQTSDKRIEPGTSEILRLKYNPRKKGKFKKTVPVFINVSTEPIYLTLSGDVDEIPTDGNPCPDFGRSYMAALDKRNAQLKALKQFQILKRQNDASTNELKEEEKDNQPNTNPENGPVVQQTAVRELTAEERYQQMRLAEFNEANFKYNNIVFLVDVSNSMAEDGRIELMRQSMHELIDMLRPQDKIAIITYATKVDVLLPPTPAKFKQDLHHIIDTLKAGGKTAGAEGLNVAYELAKENEIENGNNQIILASDGIFRVNDDKGGVKQIIQRNRRKQIDVTVVGLKNEGFTERGMRMVAKLGGGHYLNISNKEDTKTVLKEEIREKSYRF